MKNVVRVFCIMIITIFMSIACVGCGRFGTCDECGQREKLKRYVCQGKLDSDIKGDVVYLCEDCTQLAKFLGY